MPKDESAELFSAISGLPSDVTAECDATVTIPLRPGGAESLNVAAAAAIACERISSPALPEVGS